MREWKDSKIEEMLSPSLDTATITLDCVCIYGRMCSSCIFLERKML
jgi:hypothetical protein